MQLPDFIRKSPFSKLLLFFIAGTLSSGLFCASVNFSGLIPVGLVILSLTIGLIVVNHFPGFHTNWLAGLISGVILFMAGFANVQVHNLSGNLQMETATYKGTLLIEICDSPVLREKTVKATAMIRIRLRDGKWRRDNQKILVYFEKDSASAGLAAGDRIIARVGLQGISSAMNPGEFDYKKYLAARGIHNQAYLPAEFWIKSGNPGRKSLMAQAQILQQQLLQSYRKISMNNTCFSILSALTLGYKSDLETQTKQMFSEAGVMHVMALSGFNVAIIVMALGFLMVFFDRSHSGRIMKTMIVILIIWLFAFITGLSPSVTRASVMVSVIMTGKLINRQVNTYNILFASAFLILMISPALIYDVSFQLSFAAVFGIVMIQPPLYRLIKCRHFITDKIWQLFVVSCAAQLSTLPLTLYYFHQFPVYFWLTNLYVVPLVSVIICVAGLFLLVSAFDPLMLVVGKVLSILLGALYKVVSFTEFLPFSLIENIHISRFQSVLLVMLILYLCLFLTHRKIAFLWPALVLVLTFQLAGVRHNMAINKQKVIMVGELKSISAIHLISGREGTLLCSSPISTEDPGVRYAFGEFWIRHGVAEHLEVKDISNGISATAQQMHGFTTLSTWTGKNEFMCFAGRRIILMQDNEVYNWQTDKPLRVDLVIVSGKMRPDLDTMLGLLNPGILILDSSVKNHQAVQWIESCRRSGTKYWSVKQQGAYVLAIR